MKKLEESLLSLLKKDQANADRLMHEFVVETARAVMESLRDGEEEEIDAEGDINTEFFTEADLTIDDASDVLSDDLGADDIEDAAVVGDELGGEEVADAEFGPELEDEAVEGDVEGEAGEVEELEAKIEDIEQTIADLVAEFESFMAEAGVDGEEAGEAEVEAIEGGDEAGEFVGGDEEEEFEDLEESFIDELKTISVPNEEGLGTDGKKVPVEKASPLTKDLKAGSGPALASKGTPHKGFDREAAPKVVAGKKYDNVRAKAADGNSAVPAGGSKKAELSKPVKSANLKTPLPTGKK